jgi:conjugal transfer pilus assembly protein TraB
MIKKVQKYWNAISSKNRKLILYTGVAIVGMVVLGKIYSDRSDTISKRPAKKASISLDNPELVKEHWTQLSQRKLDALTERLKEIEERVDKNPTTVPAGPEDADGKVDPDDLAARLDALIAKAPIKKGEVDAIEPPVPMNTVKQRAQRDHTIDADQSPKTIVHQQTGPTINQERLNQSQPPQRATTNATQAPGGPMRLMSIIQSSAPESDQALEAQNATVDLASAFVPAGTFIPGMLMTGLDAPCGARAQSGPHPVLIRLQELSFLPNEVRQDWKGCFVLGEGYGELSSERAYIRLVNLSCVNKKDESVLDMPIKGYVADQDSKNGLRGEVVSKQGVFVARTLMAAFVEGVAEGFSQSQQTIVTTDSGTVSSNEIDNFGDGFRTGFASGASDAAKKLSDFYMDLAEDIFPIIEIGSQRHMTLILTEGIDIKFNKQLYTQARIHSNETL